MSKMIFVVEVPNNCSRADVEVVFEAPNMKQIHTLDYNKMEIEHRQRAYNILFEKLKDLKLG